MAATILCAVGLLALALAIASSPARRQLKALGNIRHHPMLQGWEVPAITAGGVFVAVGQARLASVVGVGEFTLAFVTGQTVAGLLADRLGLNGGPQRPLTAFRLAACVVALGGVALSATVQDGEGAGFQAGVLALCAVVGGALTIQQTANGRLTVATGAPSPVALLNFVLGFAVSVGLLGVIMWLRDDPLPVPADPWPYLVGLVGAAVVLVAAVAVPIVGVLVVAMALVGGQVIGALVIEVATSGTAAMPIRLASALLVITGVVLAFPPNDGSATVAPTDSGAEQY
jgi:transporter family-2 protein